MPEVPLPAASVTTWQRENGDQLTIHLVSKHPLWGIVPPALSSLPLVRGGMMYMFVKAGHVLYPSARQLGRYLELHADAVVRHKRVLELGAGGGLPSIVAALAGAECVVVTDFPDPDLVANLKRNVEVNLGGSTEVGRRCHVKGYTWGRHHALTLLPLASTTTTSATTTTTTTITTTTRGATAMAFDVVLLADVVFNHSQHGVLLQSCAQALSGKEATGLVLCFFAHHRVEPHFVERDLGWLRLARAQGWTCEEVVHDMSLGVSSFLTMAYYLSFSLTSCFFTDAVMLWVHNPRSSPQPAFPEEEGDYALRATVQGWLMRPPRPKLVDR